MFSYVPRFDERTLIAETKETHAKNNVNIPTTGNKKEECLIYYLGGYFWGTRITSEKIDPVAAFLATSSIR